MCIRDRVPTDRRPWSGPARRPQRWRQPDHLHRRSRRPDPRRVRPVSYTHLDVYKRQALYAAVGMAVTRTATDRWLEDPDRIDLAELVRAGFAALPGPTS